MNLAAARELNRQEEAQQQPHLWVAILAAHGTLTAGGLAGLPAVHVEYAKATLLRAGNKGVSDRTGMELRAITVTSGACVWPEIDDNDSIFRDGAIVGGNDDLYITTQQHHKRSDLLPGSTAIKTLSRLLRTEPEDSTVLDLMWGELTPYNAKRRDPQDGKVYMPIYEQGVTLCELHYSHLVPSEYKLVEGSGDGDGGDDTVPRWAGLEDGYTFNISDRFSGHDKTYEVPRQFFKVGSYRPPVLIGDFYQLAEQGGEYER